MNPNLFVWTSDWHLVSNDSERGVINETVPTDAGNVAAHISLLEPAGVIDLGDCKDHYSVGQGDEHDRYIEKVSLVLPEMKVLPGNHDELNDFSAAGSDFTPFNDKFWGPPYHWTLDWDAPQVRFIGFHARIVHIEDTLLNVGFFAVDQGERDWVRAELEALPDGWQAIICSHAPLNPTFGANIGHWSWLNYGGAELRAILTLHSPRIAAYLNGHRHGNMEQNVMDGIPHLNGPGMAYTVGNGYGGWVPITYEPALRTLIFDFRLGPPSTYPRVNGYTPIVIQLPPLAVEPEPTPLEEALAELRLTTVGYRNKYWTTPPVGTHWRNALDLLGGE